MKYDAYETIQFNNPKDFWDYLSPERLIQKNPSKYIFRGQSDSKWELKPKVLRKENKYNEIMYGQETSDTQVFLEYLLINKFIEGCDQVGLSVPGDSLSFRKNVLNMNINDVFIKNPAIWPTDSFIEVLSLAQHYGVPTRLLDWSKNPYIAAYFASVEAISWDLDKYSNPDNKIAIWILDISKQNLYSIMINNENKPLFELVKLPGSNNRNINRQNGIFTLQRYYDLERGVPYDYSCLEDIFTILANTPLTKITLPTMYSLEIYEKCNLYGINAASLFPDYNGVAKNVMDNINEWKKHLKRF
jgi:FRG domain